MKITLQSTRHFLGGRLTAKEEAEILDCDSYKKGFVEVEDDDGNIERLLDWPGKPMCTFTRMRTPIRARMCASAHAHVRAHARTCGCKRHCHAATRAMQRTM